MHQIHISSSLLLSTSESGFTVVSVFFSLAQT